MSTTLASDVGASKHFHDSHSTLGTELVVKRVEDHLSRVFLGASVPSAGVLFAFDADEGAADMADDCGIILLEEARWDEGGAGRNRAVEGINGAELVVLLLVLFKLGLRENASGDIVVHDREAAHYRHSVKVSHRGFEMFLQAVVASRGFASSTGSGINVVVIKLGVANFA